MRCFSIYRLELVVLANLIGLPSTTREVDFYHSVMIRFPPISRILFWASDRYDTMTIAQVCRYSSPCAFLPPDFIGSFSLSPNLRYRYCYAISTKT